MRARVCLWMVFCLLSCQHVLIRYFPFFFGSTLHSTLNTLHSTVYELDLYSGSQRRMLFSGGKPACIVFTNSIDDKGISGKAARRATLVAAKEWIGKYGVESMNFFLGNSWDHVQAMKEFGLKAKDAPIAVIHHVHRNPQAKYIMNRKITYSEFTSRRLLRFFSKVQKGKVKRMKGRMSHRYEEL